MKKVLLVLLIGVFLVFSYFKFFTIRVSFSADPTVAIVKTSNINLISNTRRVTEEKISRSWYSDNGYEVLYADEHGGIYGPYHEKLVLAWWIILGYFIFLLKKKFIKQETV